MGLIDDNLKKIDNRIAIACKESNRRGNEVTLVAISKTRSAEIVLEARRSGLVHFGENRIQEALEKIPAVGEGPIWHMVGHLQTNKVRKAVKLFDIIESIDSLKLSKAISEECTKNNISMKVLLEVNSTGESSKYGLQPDEVLPIADEVNKMENLSLEGLMTVGPFTDDSEEIDRAFSLTKELFNKMQDKLGSRIKTLSMGMSADFERAIKYGSTEIRIGTAIFGARNV